MLTLGERLVAVIAAHRHILSIVPLFLLCSTSMAGQQAERERLDDADEQYRHQRREVEEAASAATAIGVGAAASTRTRVRRRPCPVPAGTPVGGRSVHTRVVCGTSAMYHKSAAARRSSRAVSRPKPSSQRAQRAGNGPRARSPATISPASSGRVRNVTSAGTPQQRHVGGHPAAPPPARGG